MNRVTAEAVEFIKQTEGFRSDRYFCPAGIPTIGYGHAIQPGEHFTTITEAEADDLLRQDIGIAGQRVLQLVTVPLSDNQFSALVSLVFNLGVTPLKGTLGAKLNADNYEGAAEQFEKWVYAGGRKVDGLVRRREAERELFEKE